MPLRQTKASARRKRFGPPTSAGRLHPVGAKDCPFWLNPLEECASLRSWSAGRHGLVDSLRMPRADLVCATNPRPAWHTLFYRYCRQPSHQAISDVARNENPSSFNLSAPGHRMDYALPHSNPATPILAVSTAYVDMSTLGTHLSHVRYLVYGTDQPETRTR